MNQAEVIAQALNGIILQLVAFLPKLIMALVIWYVGKYLVNLAVILVRRIDVRKTKVDEKAVQMATNLVEIIGRIIVVLVILDYLGIGRTIIASLTQGFTFAIAIALGLAFGRALEEDAKKAVQSLKRLFED